MALGIPAWQQWRSQRGFISAREAATQAQQSLQESFNDHIAPLIQDLGKVLQASDDQSRVLAQGQVTNRVLSAARELLGGDGRRYSCFRYEPASRSLVPTSSLGRRIQPQTCFREDEREGAAVFGALHAGRSRFVEDTLATPPLGWDASRTRSYRTFIASPVKAGNTVLGMLCVDGESPGDLSKDHIPIVAMLADILAYAWAEAQSPPRGSAPDARSSEAGPKPPGSEPTSTADGPIDIRGVRQEHPEP